MGRFRTTGIFAGIVICFIAYVYVFEYKKSDEEKLAKAEASKIFGVKEDEIVRIQLNWAAGETVLTKNDKNEWILEKPIQDAVDESAIKSLVKSIIEEASEETITEDPTVDLSIYGLKDPLGVVTINLKSGATKKATFGTVEAIGNKKYVLFESDSKIGLITSFAQGKFVKTPKDLRSKKILRLNRSDIVSFQLKFPNKKTEVIIIKDEKGVWNYSGKNWETEALEVERYLAQIENLAALDFVSEDKNKDEAKKNYSTQKTIAKLEFKTKEGSEVLTVHDIKGADVYISSSVANTVYKITKASYDSLEVTSADKFRNKKKPFEFNKDSIESIDIQTDLIKAQIKKEGSEWKSANVSTEKKLDQEQVQRLVEAVHSLSAEKYLGDLKKSEFKKPLGSIVFKGPQEVTVFELKLGSDISEKERWVVTNKANEVISVSKLSLASLPLQTLFKEEKPEAKP